MHNQITHNIPKVERFQRANSVTALLQARVLFNVLFEDGDLHKCFSFQYIGRCLTLTPPASNERRRKGEIITYV